ncbi:MAG: phosphotransferase family protein [Acidimicrobiia bacterium]
MSIDGLDPEIRKDEALLGRVRAVAVAVLSRHGDDLALAQPTNGWVNPGWLTDRHAVRVGLVPAQRRLHREAAVGRALPAEVGYPEIVEVGVIDGHEYLLTRRIEGTDLAAVWATLTPTVRADALRQMWDLADAVHRTSLGAPKIAELGSSPFYADTPADAFDALNAVHAAGLFTTSEASTLAMQVERFYARRPEVPAVLNHGDLYIGNALWNGRKVVSLLDFEFAVTAPMELDLNELAKHVFGPDTAHEGESSLSPEQRTLRDVASRSQLDAVLLVGYSILLETWFTRRELHRRTLDEVRATDSYQRLVALADGEGGYLAPMLRT